MMKVRRYQLLAIYLSLAKKSKGINSNVFQLLNELAKMNLNVKRR